MSERYNQAAVRISDETAPWQPAVKGASPTRVLIEGISPQVDGGSFPVKRCIGERLCVEVDLVVDGHEHLAGRVLYRPEAGEWREVWLEPLVNDRWRAVFVADQLGYWQYTIEAWVDHFATWRDGFVRKRDAGQDVSVDLLIAARLLSDTAHRAPPEVRECLLEAAEDIDDVQIDFAQRVTRALDPQLAELSSRHPHPSEISRWRGPLPLLVERNLAGFSAWYELFPRSWGRPGEHGTLRECAERLDYVQSMGFDVLYLPPIHPIGVTFRKGPNNSLQAGPHDPGSPWAIGAAEGGHKAVHPSLGTLDDFRDFVSRARTHGLEVAMDIALQVSPDHPYVHEHPEWFLARPDGTIQYAENPPKKYQDIYPFHFQTEAWEALWQELLSIFLFWIEQGVHIFRVDNPHTKSLAFWAWCVRELKQRHPEVILLSEAFTRPKLMYALAKLGFSQSYTYFTWRNTKWELVEYMRELAETPVAEFFRPNFWPNTPDILPEHLQLGARPCFITRLVLAGTLSSNYGIYGPAYELMDHRARPSSGEYLDNEKYEIKQWDLSRPDSLRPIIARLNRIRRENPALADFRTLRIHEVDNEQLMAYSKRSPDGDNVVLVVVNLDPTYTQSGWLDLDLEALGVQEGHTFQVHDLLSDARYLWSSRRTFVQLDPNVMPAHVFRLNRQLRNEQDFDYFG